MTDADATKTSLKPSGATDTWARTSYKDIAGVVVIEANSGPINVPHDLTARGLWADAVRFFGLDGSVPVVRHDGGVSASGGQGGGGGGSGTGGAVTVFFLCRNVQFVFARELDPLALVVVVLAEKTEQPAMLLLERHRAKSAAELIDRLG